MNTQLFKLEFDDSRNQISVVSTHQSVIGYSASTGFPIYKCKETGILVLSWDVPEVRDDRIFVFGLNKTQNIDTKFNVSTKTYNKIKRMYTLYTNQFKSHMPRWF